MRARNDLIRNCLIFGLSLGTTACAYSQNSAPADNGAIGATADAPGVDAAFDRSVSTKAAAGALRDRSGRLISLKSLSATRERPLFSPTRRPPASVAPLAPPVQASSKTPEPDPPALTLVGTIIGQDQSTGIFVDQATKKVIRLRTGQDHAGWTLRAIHEHDATFERDQRKATLAMSSARQSAAAPGARWTDGDGQVISPPSSAVKNGDGEKPEKLDPQPATWRDGDGQLISPPTERVRKSAQN